LGAEVLGEIGKNCAAILFGNAGSQAFHFLQLFRPVAVREVLLRDASGIVTLRTGRLDFGLHGPGRKRLPRSTGSLGKGERKQDKQKDGEGYTLKQAGIPENSRLQEPIRVTHDGCCKYGNGGGGRMPNLQVQDVGAGSAPILY